MSAGYRYETETRGHTWQKDEDDDIDIFAYANEAMHNGPRCVTCGYGFCHHCGELPEQDCV